MSEETRVYWLLGASAAALLAAIWLTGALSAAIFGSGWAPIPLSGLLATALRLPAHLGDPGAAWPRGVRAALPGPLGFYSVAVLLLAAAALLAILATRAGELVDLPAIAGNSRRRAPSARWASRRELAPLRVAAPQPARLTLGKSGRNLLAAQERQSVIVFGPTSTLKTTGLAIPALLEWQGPVLATSVKNDLLADTLARRAALGKVMVFDPAQVIDKKMPRSRATPLWGARSWRGAMRVAHWLSAAARTARSGMHDAEFWFAAAEKLLAPLLFAAATDGRTIGEVVRWLDEGPEASEAEIGELLEATEVSEAERAWLATQNREARQRSSVYTTAELVMAAFADPKVIEETAASDYTPTSLLDGRANTLYLCAPLHEQERLRTLFSMIVQELLAVVYESAAATGEPIDPPLLLLLDEAANIAPIPNLDEIASTGAGQGIQLLSIFQDFAQLNARYGRRSATIVNNHRAKIFGTGISDPEALSYVSRIVGVGEFEQRSRTAGERGRRSTTEGDTYRDLVPGNVLRQADPGSGLLVYGHLPPAKIRLRPWFRESKLKEAARSIARRFGGKGGASVSLDQSDARRGNPQPSGAGRPTSGERKTDLGGNWPTLGEAAVPMRGTTQRELDRDREERIRVVLEKPRRRLPRLPTRVPAFGLAGLATILLGIALAGALDERNGAGSPPESAGASARPAGAAPLASNANPGAALRRKARVTAHTRRRAAIRANREAVRRRARQRRARRKVAARAKSDPQAAPTDEAIASSDEGAEAAAPPAEPVASTSPPPPPTSSSQSQVQREFGFER